MVHPLWTGRREDNNNQNQPFTTQNKQNTTMK